MKPYPYSPRAVLTAFCDLATGVGITEHGTPLAARVSDPRRATPTVGDLLDAAHAAGVGRLYVTGKRPPSGWLLDAAPAGWTAGALHLDLDAPVGRFTHDGTADKVELRRAAEWFGGGAYSPSDARAAWRLLGDVYGHAFRGARLLSSPAATGLDGWARTLGKDDDPQQLPDDLAELVRSTSPQHRVELFTADPHRQTCGDCAPLVTAARVPAFHYLDGRLMYASLTRELGCAPATMVTGAQAREFYNDGNEHARARYHVRFQVPAGWDRAGLLLCKYEDGTWHAPNRPGAVGQTWCDASELSVALAHGWPCEPVEGLLFTPGRPLDKWTRRLVEARERAGTVGDADELVRDLTRGAVRNMLLFGIGGFHSRGRTNVRVTSDPRTIPADVTPEPRGPGRYIWRERATPTGRAAAFAHPEWSSQVWGRAHARLLDAPTGDKNRRAGLLHLAPADVLGVYGDALYLTTDPGWPDDGRVGRFRHKGAVRSTVQTPTTADARNKLRARAERNEP